MEVECENRDGVAEYEISGRKLSETCASEETAAFCDWTEEDWESSHLREIEDL